ncbi:phage tail tube protein [Brevundimonas sp.]|uniref:phage tail tube protein n=1 Tax=Brevundimonas sp. TaxID=1871086 RepID=UPI004034C5C3
MTDAYVNVVSGEAILVQIGNDADPQVFAHDCIINGSRALSLTTNTSEQTIPNCTDPSKPDKVVRRVDSTDSTISGDGKLHSDSVLAWLQRRGKIVDVRVRQAGVWRVAGQYIVSEFTVTGQSKEFATASITLVQADDPEITDDTP